MKIKFDDLRIDEYTTPCPICIEETEKLERAIELFETHEIRHIPVVDADAKLVGLITQRDLQAFKSLLATKELNVADMMIKNPESIYSGSLLSDAVFKMSEEKIGSLIVIEKGDKINGIFTSTDALNALIEVLRDQVLA